jgi:hypothetical protein
MSGADGAFCLVGPQGHSGSLAGGHNVTFPAQAGDCSAPASCVDVGAFDITDEMCQHTATPFSAEFSCEITRVSGCVLIADPFAPDSDDVPPTIANVTNPITGRITNLADCANSAKAVAAKACANAAANISPDGNDIWSCTVEYAAPTISNCH